jgi:putative redox protein
MHSGVTRDTSLLHDIYDAAVGGCRMLAMLWHARRHAIPVEDIKVHISRDAARVADGLYHLIATIEVSGNLTLEQRSALLDAAARCPVQKLTNNVRTEITTLMV